MRRILFSFAVVLAAVAVVGLSGAPADAQNKPTDHPDTASPRSVKSFPPLPPGAQLVKVHRGTMTLFLPPHLGGGAVVSEGLRGTFVRSFSGRGDRFTIHLISLSMPSVELPIPGNPETGPIRIQEAIGPFDPSDVAVFGEPNTGSVDVDTGILTETLGLDVSFPLLEDLGAGSVRLLLSGVEEGFDRFSGSTQSWTATGAVVDEGPFEGTEVSGSGFCKGSDYTISVGATVGVSIGRGNIPGKCRQKPAGVVTCTGVLAMGFSQFDVTCLKAGGVTLTLSYTDINQRRRSKTVRVHCVP